MNQNNHPIRLTNPEFNWCNISKVMKIVYIIVFVRRAIEFHFENFLNK
jgi:hypothetical protein